MCGSLLRVLPGREPLEPAPADLLRREALALAARLRRLTPERWAGPTARAGWSRAELALHLAEVLAGRALAVEGLPARPLPRPASDVALPDVVAVCGDDLARACAQEGRDDVAAAGLLEVLGHRAELLGDDVPPRLATRAAVVLGVPGPVPDVLAVAACPLVRSPPA